MTYDSTPYILLYFGSGKAIIFTIIIKVNMNYLDELAQYSTVILNLKSHCQRFLLTLKNTGASTWKKVVFLQFSLFLDKILCHRKKIYSSLSFLINFFF